MTGNIQRRGTARGFSLLELMVAVTISLLLLMGVVALFVSSRASYETTEKLSRIQESGRYALDQIANDLRAAGYQGCSRPVGSGERRKDYLINTLPVPRNNLIWNVTQPVQGFQGTGDVFAPELGPALADGQMPNPVPSPDADLLAIRIPVRDSAPMVLSANQLNPSDPLQVTALPAEPRPLGPAVITDCRARTWFQITGYGANEVRHANTGNFDIGPDGEAVPTDSLKHAYVKDAEIVPLTTVLYYLARRNEGDPPGHMSLYRKEGTSASEEIAEGIDRLEMRYGVDTDNNGRVDSYVDADDIPGAAGGAPNWDTVYSVQISLLARAPEAYGNDVDAQQYTLLTGMNGEETVTAGPFPDRFQRKVFTVTAALRNQIID